MGGVEAAVYLNHLFLSGICQEGHSQSHACLRQRDMLLWTCSFITLSYGFITLERSDKLKGMLLVEQVKSFTPHSTFQQLIQSDYCTAKLQLENTEVMVLLITTFTSPQPGIKPQTCFLSHIIQRQFQNNKRPTE